MMELEEKIIDAMVDLFVKDDAPKWVKEKVKEELRKQRRADNLWTDSDCDDCDTPNDCQLCRGR